MQQAESSKTRYHNSQHLNVASAENFRFQRRAYLPNCQRSVFRRPRDSCLQQPQASHVIYRCRRGPSSQTAKTFVKNVSHFLQQFTDQKVVKQPSWLCSPARCKNLSSPGRSHKGPPRKFCKLLFQASVWFACPVHVSQIACLPAGNAAGRLALADGHPGPAGASSYSLQAMPLQQVMGKASVHGDGRLHGWLALKGRSSELLLPEWQPQILRG